MSSLSDWSSTSHGGRTCRERERERLRERETERGRERLAWEERERGWAGLERGNVEHLLELFVGNNGEEGS